MNHKITVTTTLSASNDDLADYGCTFVVDEKHVPAIESKLTQLDLAITEAATDQRAILIIEHSIDVFDPGDATFVRTYSADDEHDIVRVSFTIEPTDDVATFGPDATDPQLRFAKNTLANMLVPALDALELDALDVRLPLLDVDQLL